MKNKYLFVIVLLMMFLILPASATITIPKAPPENINFWWGSGDNITTKYVTPDANDTFSSFGTIRKSLKYPQTFITTITTNSNHSIKVSVAYTKTNVYTLGVITDYNIDKTISVALDGGLINLVNLADDSGLKQTITIHTTRKRTVSEIAFGDVPGDFIDGELFTLTPFGVTVSVNNPSPDFMNYGEAGGFRLLEVNANTVQASFDMSTSGFNYKQVEIPMDLSAGNPYSNWDITNVRVLTVNIAIFDLTSEFDQKVAQLNPIFRLLIDVIKLFINVLRNFPIHALTDMTLTEEYSMLLGIIDPMLFVSTLVGYAIALGKFIISFGFYGFILITTMIFFVLAYALTQGDIISTLSKTASMVKTFWTAILKSAAWIVESIIKILRG